MDRFRSPFGTRFRFGPSHDPSRGPTLDMTPDGEFREPPPGPFAARVFRVAVLVAAVAAIACVAALALWFALVLIPVALIAGLVAWGALRWQLWRARRAATDGRRDLFRSDGPY